MAAVINLDTVRLMRNIDETPQRQSQDAEIILFPGIRYERWDEEISAEDADASLPTAGKCATSRD